MTAVQPATEAAVSFDRFPRTRYQGSKRKSAPAIVQTLHGLDFHTVLDAFGGTGAVSYAFKCAGKAVTYNDALAFNHQIGLALIENNHVRIDEASAARMGDQRPCLEYRDFIQRTFRGIYYTDEENRWLDRAVANVRAMRGRFQRAMAWHALCQAAIAKRPYNLFHRRNLYMRTAAVDRTFGNKASWDRPFGEHVTRFVREANHAVIDTGVQCRATRCDALTVAPGYDLVYIDPPYVNGRGIGVNYRDFYHFLEGILRYDDWAALVDYRSRHRRLTRRPDPWSDSRRSSDLFRTFFDQFRDSILVVSYRSDGTPSIENIHRWLRDRKRRVRIVSGRAYPYALSTNRRSREVLLIGTD